MLDKIIEFIAWLWNGGSRVFAIVLGLFVIIGLAELAQSNLLGDTPFRVASKTIPWNPLFLERASLDASFTVNRPDGTASVLDREARKCPLGSNITFEYERNRSGYVAALGLTEPFQIQGNAGVYGLTNPGTEAEAVSGETRYEGAFSITSADGLELLVVIGADKPFDPAAEIVPALRKLEAEFGKGGTAALSGYDLDWTDRPIIVMCESIE